MAENREKPADSYDVAVIGAGPAGLTAAVALGVLGCRTLCAGPISADSKRPDTRTTALLKPSVQLLSNLGVWQACAGKAAPLEAIRLIDDTGALLRAPEVLFRAGEIGCEVFGYNIANTALTAALAARAVQLKPLDIVETRAAISVEPDGDSVLVTLAEGRRIRARLVAGADGRRSLCRTAAGINTTAWSYDQAAIACNFEHEAEHGNVSNEFHRRTGPFTTVPMRGCASALVWVERPAEAERLAALGNAAMAEAIEERLQGLLGRVTSVGPRAVFPLSGQRVRTFAQNRIALVGEAAHVVPPIGAQGLNLGFRDAAGLAEIAGAAVQAGKDPGGSEALGAYDRARRDDVLSRIFAVDMLNRSLLSGLMPVQAARGAGLHLLRRFAPLREFVMRRGVAPAAGLPKLMQAPAP